MTAILLRKFGLVALVFVLGAFMGWRHRAGLADAERVARDERTAQLLILTRQAGDAAAERLRGELFRAAAYTADLQEKVRRASTLVVPVPRGLPAAAGDARPAAAAGGDVAAGPDAAAAVLAAAAPGAGEPRPPPPAAGDADGVRLSLAAVSLWNSALAGTDVPAAACRAADPADPTCAADSGLNIAAAWSNHVLNAARCADDRRRQQALIDFIQRQSAAVGAAP